MKKLLMMIGAAGFLGAFLPYTAQARSMLYYYDFDTVTDGVLQYEDVNKGTGTASVTLKNYGADALGYDDGALGSDHTFNNSTKAGLWIGDGSTSMGCGTDKGFTIAFWVKAALVHGNAWTDFFGFRLAGYDYRCEYNQNNNVSTKFILYGGGATATSSSNQLQENDNAVTELTAGEWKHFALVFEPGTNSMNTCRIYVDGVKVNSLKVLGGGDLQCVRLGALQMRNGSEYSHNSSVANTSIDELAVFDYPVSADQLKWLCAFTPGQPAGGPGREMPVRWHFDETDGRGLTAKNSGTGDYAAYKWNPKNYAGKVDSTEKSANDYAMYRTPGALDSAHGFGFDMQSNDNIYWTIFSATNLDATVGSGYTFSFWLYAQDGAQAWRSIFGYTVGGKTYRLVWNNTTPRKLYIAGTMASATVDGWTPETWQHVCVTWNAADKKTDIYINGVRQNQQSFSGAALSDTDTIGRISVGPWAEGSNISEGYYASYKAVTVDEFAFFNHSLSPDQIKTLGSQLPALPPMDATNLVRTVSADCAWAGAGASWTQQEWDGEAWAATTRTAIYPSCEDVDVVTAVSFTGNATITNDTFVTCKRLAFSNASGAESVSPTLVCAEGSRFAPQSLEVGDGVVLNASAQFGNPLSVGGTLTIGEGSRIVFNADALLASDTDDDEWKTIMAFGDVALPTGAADILAFVGVQSGKYRLALSSDGKSVLAKRVRGLIISFR